MASHPFPWSWTRLSLRIRHWSRRSRLNGTQVTELQPSSQQQQHQHQQEHKQQIKNVPAAPSNDEARPLVSDS